MDGSNMPNANRPNPSPQNIATEPVAATIQA